MNIYIIVPAVALVTGVLCFFLGKFFAERKVAELKAKINSDENMLNAFKALSSEALNTNNRSFLELAKTTLEKYQEGAKHDLDKRQEAINNIVSPVKETLNKFETKISEIEKERKGAYEGLVSQVGVLMKQTQTLSNALTSSSVRGRWGELQLKKLVELAGMLNSCDFVEQESALDADDKRRRPDMIIRMPGGGNIVVDSKTPMSKFIEAVETQDNNLREQKMKEFVLQIREALKSLSLKNYWAQFQPTPEFVVLFMPGESYFAAALNSDPSLIEDAVKEKVIIATPTTLISLLKAVAYGWRSSAMEENAREIENIGRDLYDRIVTMTEHFESLGDSIDDTVKNYNKMIASYDKRVMPGVKRFKELNVSDKELPEILDSTIEITTKKLN